MISSLNVLLCTFYVAGSSVFFFNPFLKLCQGARGAWQEGGGGGQVKDLVIVAIIVW